MLEVEKKIAIKCLEGLKLIGTSKVEFVRDKFFEATFNKECYMLYLYEEKKEIPKREEKKLGVKGLFMVLDGTENETLCLLIEMIREILEPQENVYYEIDYLLKVTDKWKKNG